LKECQRRQGGRSSLRREKRSLFFLSFTTRMPVFFPRAFAQEGGRCRVVEARQVELEQARPLGVVRAAKLLLR